ncbi:MAG: PQQ-binding-like beta-propeller repeat protein [Verrucomicrobia bacterium]|nr:PQQ-binding-like beta-propeller repeat protein [Verrucomicrobiota bacterium]
MPAALGLGLAGALIATAPLPAAPVTGWLRWRGPDQNGTSRETGLPDAVDARRPLWTADLPGQSTPVLANDRLYILGYVGDGPNLQEVLACFDAETGGKLWQQGYSDFLSDIIYKRYATSCATIDPETGNVYMQGTQGILAAFTPDGGKRWDLSMMELYGRLTFPNGRTASPAIDGDLVITRGITSNWGAQGPGADRFYAFDKKTGELVWASTPGERPHDNSFSHPVFGWFKGRRVFYAATGDGSVVCVNARTGEPLWRVHVFKAGINSSLLVHHDDKIIAIYGTPYEPGQMIALKIPDVLPASPAAAPVVVAPATVELWHNEIRTSTSSPIVVGDRVFVTSEVGVLFDVDANTGRILWKMKIGIEQRNGSPVYADGKLYVPMLNEPGAAAQATDEGSGGHGAFYVIRPSDRGGEIISHTVLDGRCHAAPTVYNGKVYVQTTEKLYCFGAAGNNPGLPPAPTPRPWPAPGPAASLEVIPSEVLLRPGQSVSFRVRSLDANGFTVQEAIDPRQVKWEHYVPPTAKVRAAMKASFSAAGELTAAADPVASAGAFRASVGDLKGYFRGRVLPYPPFTQDFESFKLSETTTNDVEPPTPFAYPPLPWIGARFKFDVRDLNGNKVLAKTIDNRFFQRATVFIGGPDAKNYTIEADVMSDGNRYKMSEVGLIDQRYRVVLKGNARKLQVTSNEELFKFEVPFAMTPHVWYHLKSRVDVRPDGSGVIRAKVWKKSDPEPEPWTIQVPTAHPNTTGAPGLFAFAPQDVRVYVDNIAVTPNP